MSGSVAHLVEEVLALDRDARRSLERLERQRIVRQCIALDAASRLSLERIEAQLRARRLGPPPTPSPGSAEADTHGDVEHHDDADEPGLSDGGGESAGLESHCGDAEEDPDAEAERDGGGDSYGRCSFYGCVLRDRHAGLHSCPAPQGRRARSETLRYGYAAAPPASSSSTRPSAAAFKRAATMMMQSERAQDGADGEGGEGDEDEEDEEGEEGEEDDSGSPPTYQGTFVDHVNRMRSEFEQWMAQRTTLPAEDPRSNNTDHGLQMCSTIPGGISMATLFMKGCHNKQKPTLCDSRLSIRNTLMEWGASRSRTYDNHWRRAARLQFMVRQQPECLQVDSTAEKGQWFCPVDEAWVFGTPDAKHGWKASLCTKITRIMAGLMHKDRLRLIARRNVQNPQPPGRYITPGDWIGMWNKSCGKCPTCPNDIWIGYDPEHEAKPPGGCRATIQRLDNSIIHLHSNCAKVLICMRCNVTKHAVARDEL